MPYLHHPPSPGRFAAPPAAAAAGHYPQAGPSTLARMDRHCLLLADRHVHGEWFDFAQVATDDLALMLREAATAFGGGQ